jgi:hypothetical protein
MFQALLGCAAGGLVLSVAVHLGSLAGFEPPGGIVLFWGLNVGAVLLPLILFSNTLPGTSDLMSEDVKWWRLLDYPGCPAWMNYTANGFRIYFLLNFALMVLMSFLSPGPPTISMSYHFGTGDPSIATWRGFSSGWMAFYSGSLAFLTTAYRASR